MADDYAFPKGELMRGKKGLVMGVANHNSIAWGIASQLAAQGAEMAFTYQGEELERRVRPLAESIGVKTMIPADVTDDASMDAAFAEIEKVFGTIDFEPIDGLVFTGGFNYTDDSKDFALAQQSFDELSNINLVDAVIVGQIAAATMTPP